MARPQETFNKKELEKKKLQKRKEKAQRRDERKANAKEGKSFEDMLAYVDENGNISSTPPDPTKKKTINAQDIVTGSRNIEGHDPVSSIRKGKVTFFNSAKGFGFIKDDESGQSVFVHSRSVTVAIKENDRVLFETIQDQRGPSAINVKLLR
jgi:cold shock CspA family protein